MTKLIRGINNLSLIDKPTVVTIGNFDGMHLGHQNLLQKVIQKAKDLNCLSTVIIFEPQPLEFFKSEDCVPRLSRLREKFAAVSAFGIDQLLVLKFDKYLAQITPDQFIQEIIIKKLQAQYVIVGDDFHFGKNRSGSLVNFENAGLPAEQMPTTYVNQQRVSSTWIREVLAKGDLKLAHRLLKKPYTMMGRIVHGNRLGRKLGFPTANIHLHRIKTPLQGIYAVKMHGISSQPELGVANLGTRPAVGGTRTLLEVHLLNFNREIYCQYVTVEFCQKFRDEAFFPTLELLRQQIEKDVRQAKSYFEELAFAKEYIPITLEDARF